MNRQTNKYHRDLPHPPQERKTKMSEQPLTRKKKEALIALSISGYSSAKEWREMCQRLDEEVTESVKLEVNAELNQKENNEKENDK